MLSEIYKYDIISNDTVNPPNNGLMESYYYLTEHLGSITEIVDENIEIVGIAQYSSFGSLLSSAGIFAEQPYSYTAREHDQESNLYYYRARYYNANIGRFLQQDPYLEKILLNINESKLDNNFKEPIIVQIFKNLGKIQLPVQKSFKDYLYTNNNSINKIDPSGEFDLCFALETTATGFFYGTIAAAPVLTLAAIGAYSEGNLVVGHKIMAITVILALAAPAVYAFTMTLTSYLKEWGCCNW